MSNDGCELEDERASSGSTVDTFGNYQVESLPL